MKAVAVSLKVIHKSIVYLSSGHSKNAILLMKATIHSQLWYPQFHDRSLCPYHPHGPEARHLGRKEKELRDW